MKRERPFRGIRRPLASDHLQSISLGGQTPLQVWTAALFNLLADARDELSDDEYRALVEILCDRLGLEAARFVLGEALRATRDEVA